MKTLTTMEKVCCMSRFSLLLVAVSLIIGFSSCGDNDDSGVPVFSLNDVNGNYTGKVTTLTAQPQTNATEETEPGLDITAEVKDNNIFLKKLPIADLIKSIIEDPTTADQIIAAIGEVNYQVGYKASFNDKQDLIYLQLDPKPLEITGEIPAPTEGEGEEPTPFKVKVTITADEQGTFAYANQKLLFSLYATEVILGDEAPIAFLPTTFNFELNRK